MNKTIFRIIGFSIIAAAIVPGSISYYQIIGFVFPIIAAEHAEDGTYYIYPLSLQFLNTSPSSRKGGITVEKVF